MNHYPRISALLFDQPWAITPRALEGLIARVEQVGAVDLDAIAEKLGRPLENTGNRVEQRGSVAILDISGPIFRYANLMSELSGATSAEMLARDFRTAASNPMIDQILLRVDSPGGEVGGISDLAEAIHASEKPVTAYIDHLGASAAYWLASAAGKVYGAVASFAGSIGVVATMTDRKAAQERQGVKTYQIVSSNAPRKLVDPATEEGRAAVLEMVDYLGGLFVDQVARFRGVSPDQVLADFGKGMVVPARIAQRVGMIDGITNEEALIASLMNNRTTVAGFAAKEEPVLTEPIPAPAPTAVATPAAPATYTVTNVSPVAAAAPDPAVQERQRIQAILDLPEAQSRPKLARTIAFEGLSPESAQRLLAAAAVEAAAPPANPLAAAMAAVPNPAVGTGSDVADNSPEAEAARILQFVPKTRRAG